MLGAGSLGCGSSAGARLHPVPGRSVLFLGNSLTYANDLTGMVRALAATLQAAAAEALARFPNP